MPAVGRSCAGPFIGRQLSDSEAGRVGAAAVLDLTCEFSEARPFLAMAYCNLPILDLTGPTPQHLRDAVTFLTEHAGKGKCTSIVKSARAERRRGWLLSVGQQTGCIRGGGGRVTARGATVHHRASRSDGSVANLCETDGAVIGRESRVMTVPGNMGRNSPPPGAGLAAGGEVGEVILYTVARR